MSVDELDAVRAELRTAYAELAAVRQREETFRAAWRNASRDRDKHAHEAGRLRALVRRKTRVAEIGFRWLRAAREERDEAWQVARALRVDLERIRSLVSRIQARRADADEYIRELVAAHAGGNAHD